MSNMNNFQAIKTGIYLGNYDIKQRYRRSIIEPWWFTLNAVLTVGALGFLYSQILNEKITEYIPYLGIGFVIWQFISNTINESTSELVSVGHLLKQKPVNLIVFLVRLLWRNFIILMHSFPVLVLVSVFMLGFKLYVLVSMLTVLLAPMVIAPLCAVTMIASVRFRDVPPMISSILMILFFVTPIMWKSSKIGEFSWVVEINPVNHLIAVIRDPIVYGTFDQISLIVLLFWALATTPATVFIVDRFRSKLVLWL